MRSRSTSMPAASTSELSDEEIAARASDYKPPERPAPAIALAKYARLVSSASLGAVTR